MLSFAVEYRKAIEYVTSDRKNNLRKYELKDNKWKIAEELKEMLKVSVVPQTVCCMHVRLMCSTSSPHRS